MSLSATKKQVTIEQLESMSGYKFNPDTLRLECGNNFYSMKIFEGLGVWEAYDLLMAIYSHHLPKEISDYNEDYY